jgi:hypothetical protein
MLARFPHTGAAALVLLCLCGAGKHWLQIISILCPAGSPLPRSDDPSCPPALSGAEAAAAHSATPGLVAVDSIDTAKASLRGLQQFSWSAQQQKPNIVTITAGHQLVASPGSRQLACCESQTGAEKGATTCTDAIRNDHASAVIRHQTCVSCTRR